MCKHTRDVQTLLPLCHKMQLGAVFLFIGVFEAFTLGDGANLLTLLPIASVSRVLFHVQRVLSHGRVWSKKGINNLI